MNSLEVITCSGHLGFQQSLVWRLVTSAPFLMLAALSQAAQPRPNVLLLVADDLRADALGFGGNSVIRTPHLDKLASGGQVFRHAVANYPVCIPSRAEMLTGCSAFRNGVFPGSSDTLDSTLITWPAAMRDLGYRTLYIGKWHTDGRPSERGFAEVDQLFAEGGADRPMRFPVDALGRKVTGYVGWEHQADDGTATRPEQGAGLTPDINVDFVDAAIRQIKKVDSRPFFIQVNFTAPHDPLLWPTDYRDLYRPDQMQPPENFLPRHPFDNGSLDNRDEQLVPLPRTAADIRRELAIYYAVISHLDEQVGRILAALRQSGKQRNTFVIFTSDHGVAKGSHGLVGKQNLYEHTIGVPLVIVGPSLAPHVEHDALVQLMDLYPTVCELTGTAIPPAVEGKSFAPLLRGAAKLIRREVFGYFMGYQRMVRTDRYKLIVYPKIGREQLFDLKADPNEMVDLATIPRHAERLRELRQKLYAWQESVRDPVLLDVAGAP